MRCDKMKKIQKKADEVVIYNVDRGERHKMVAGCIPTAMIVSA